MIPFELFEKRTFTIPSFAIALIVFGMVGAMFFFSQLFQTVQGYTALEAGLLLMPMTLGVAVGSKLSPTVLKTVRCGIKHWRWHHYFSTRYGYFCFYD